MSLRDGDKEEMEVRVNLRVFWGIYYLHEVEICVLKLKDP